MIYKLLVNAAFLAIGYYIGKEVGLNARTPRYSASTRTPPAKPTSDKASGQTR